MLAAAGGLILDIVSGAPVGISPPALLMATAVVAVAYRRVYRRNLALPALITLLAVMVFQILYLVTLIAIGRPVSWQTGVVQVSAPLVLLHVVLMPLFYFAVSWLDSLITGPRIQLGR